MEFFNKLSFIKNKGSSETNESTSASTLISDSNSGTSGNSSSDPSPGQTLATTHRTSNNLAVEVITLKDYKKAAQTLKIAFKDDLYVNHLTAGMKDQKSKDLLNLTLFEATTYSSILEGLVVAIRDVEREKTDPDFPFLAVACFNKPPKKFGSHATTSSLNYFWSMYQSGYLKAMWMANKETRQKVFDEQWPLLEELRSQVLGDEMGKSWYLSDIGAIPEGRGKGLARRLIDYVCHQFIDVYKYPTEVDDDDNGDGNGGGMRDDDGLFDEESNRQLDDEINSYKFEFDLDSDTFTDYSGYSTYSDSDVSSLHSIGNSSTRSSRRSRSRRSSNNHSIFNNYNEEEDILAKYDRQKFGHGYGAPLYLESSHPRNRKIYEKLGFTYVKTATVGQVEDKDGKTKKLNLDLMVRGVKGSKWYRKDP